MLFRSIAIAATFTAAAGPALAIHGDAQLRGNDAMKSGYTVGSKDPAKQLGTDWLETSIFEFSAQCSHNTYTTGKQSGLPFGGLAKAHGTDPASMKVALGLGYRCMELDVHPRRSRVAKGDEAWVPKPFAPPEKSQIKVVHREHITGYTMTNSADLTLFVKNILEWMEADESTPLRDGEYRMPVIMSIENRVSPKLKDSVPAAQMARELGFLNCKADGSVCGVNRIVTAAELETLNNDWSMRNFVAEGTAPRRIIIKSKTGDKALKPWLDIVSMDQSRDKLFHSVSIMERSKIEDVDKAIKKKKFVRVYPYTWEYYSGNYQTGKFFEHGAQMVCVNYQGHTDDRNGKCLNPVRGEKTGGQCDGDRNGAAQLEAAYMEFGYDGYVRLGKMLPPGFVAAVDKNHPIGSSGPAQPPREPIPADAFDTNTMDENAEGEKEVPTFQKMISHSKGY